ncbi:MAG: hypothetical protein SGBAC_005382 [Bacillariaceae sp.]
MLDGDMGDKSTLQNSSLTTLRLRGRANVTCSQVVKFAKSFTCLENLDIDFDPYSELTSLDELLLGEGPTLQSLKLFVAPKPEMDETWKELFQKIPRMRSLRNFDLPREVVQSETCRSALLDAMWLNSSIESMNLLHFGRSNILHSEDDTFDEFYCKTGHPLAYAHAPGKSPGVVFLPGFKSTMKSTKSKSIYRYCQQHGLEFTSMDFSGHGETLSQQDHKIDNNSSLTISQWMEEALCILQNVTFNNQQIVVGSSMGAWIAVLLAQYEQQQQEEGKPSSSRKISGILGVASGPDFTSILSEQIQCNDSLKKQMSELGYSKLPTVYDETGFYQIHQHFLQDAQQHFVLDRPYLDLGIPVTLIHGTKDKDIPYTYAEQLLSKLDSRLTNELILVKDGDHRLSKPHELQQMLQALDKFRCRVAEAR